MRFTETRMVELIAQAPQGYLEPALGTLLQHLQEALGEEFAQLVAEEMLERLEVGVSGSGFRQDIFVFVFMKESDIGVHTYMRFLVSP